MPCIGARRTTFEAGRCAVVAELVPARGAPRLAVPVRPRHDPLRSQLTLVTLAGDLDVLGEATGEGTYEALFPRSEERAMFGLLVRFVDLETLIRLKRRSPEGFGTHRLARGHPRGAAERVRVSGQGREGRTSLLH